MTETKTEYKVQEMTKIHICPRCENVFGYEHGGILLLDIGGRVLKVRSVVLDECPYCRYFFEDGWRYKRIELPRSVRSHGGRR